LALGQGRGALSGVPSLGTEGGADFLFIDGGGIDHNYEPRVAQDARAGAAPRGQDQGIGERETHMSSPCLRAISRRIAAAVSSIERRVTSITGQCRSVKSRRACCTSSRTAELSVYSVGRSCS